MIICNNCKWLENAELTLSIHSNSTYTAYFCEHPHCYDVNPLTGIRDVIKSGTDYMERNKNLDCADFEQKPPPPPKPPKRKRWWRR
jgi:hypothetical protein